MLRLAILLEEGHVVDRLFNAQNQAEFVVQLDRDRSHLMLDTAAQPTFVKAVTPVHLGNCGEQLSRIT